MEIAKLIAEYRTEEFTGALFHMLISKKSPREWVCLSESHRGLNFLSVQCFWGQWSMTIDFKCLIKVQIKDF